jgi:hypothetical protein
MKLCDNCGVEINLPRATTCRLCVSRRVKYTYYERNKEKQKLKSREYRKNNREVCNLRTKESVKKKKEYYKIKKREYYRKTHGIALDDPFVKRKAGEGTIDFSGYKTITKRGHPNQMDEKGRIREHIFIMSEYLGRPLIKGESVHHLNGIRDDNRIENLELWSKAQPAGQRVKDKIKWCIEFLSQYGYVLDKE